MVSKSEHRRHDLCGWRLHTELNSGHGNHHGNINTGRDEDRFRSRRRNVGTRDHIRNSTVYTGLDFDDPDLELCSDGSWYRNLREYGDMVGKPIDRRHDLCGWCLHAELNSRHSDDHCHINAGRDEVWFGSRRCNGSTCDHRRDRTLYTKLDPDHADLELRCHGSWYRNLREYGDMVGEPIDRWNDLCGGCLHAELDSRHSDDHCHVDAGRDEDRFRSRRCNGSTCDHRRDRVVCP
jgi:hypothetical protein